MSPPGEGLDPEFLLRCRCGSGPEEDPMLQTLDLCSQMRDMLICSNVSVWGVVAKRVREVRGWRRARMEVRSGK